MNKTAIDLSVGAGAISMPWWVQLTSGLELLIAVGGTRVELISFRSAIAYKEWRKNSVVFARNIFSIGVTWTNSAR